MRWTLILLLLGLGLCGDLFGNQKEIQGELQFAHFDECKLANQDTIKECKIGYRTYGKLNDSKDNVILVPTWFTGTSKDHQYLISSNLLDPEQYFIVIVDALGNGVSSSPSNSKSQANEAFPKFSITDMVDTQHRLLTEKLNIDSVYAIFGLSMGGMQAFEWASRYPSFMTKTVAAIGSPQLAAFDIALWTTRNNLLDLYRQCQCEQALFALTGMSMISQVPDTLASRISRDAVLSAIKQQSAQRSIAQTWDSQRQAEAMLQHDIARDEQHSLDQVAKHIRSQFLILVSDDDRIVTPQPAIRFANKINAQLVRLDAGCGHADPWCAADEFATKVHQFLTPKN